jgi:hypothetical protein
LYTRTQNKKGGEINRPQTSKFHTIEKIIPKPVWAGGGGGGESGPRGGVGGLSYVDFKAYNKFFNVAIKINTPTKNQFVTNLKHIIHS